MHWARTQPRSALVEAAPPKQIARGGAATHANVFRPYDAVACVAVPPVHPVCVCVRVSKSELASGHGDALSKVSRSDTPSR